MIDKDIQARLVKFALALDKVTKGGDPTDAAGLAIEQVGETLSDIKRIADALEKISNVELHMEKVGSVAIMFMGSAEKAEVWRKENKPDE